MSTKSHAEQLRILGRMHAFRYTTTQERETLRTQVQNHTSQDNQDAMTLLSRALARRPGAVAILCQFFPGQAAWHILCHVLRSHGLVKPHWMHLPKYALFLRFCRTSHVFDVLRMHMTRETWPTFLDVHGVRDDYSLFVFDCLQHGHVSMVARLRHAGGGQMSQSPELYRACLVSADPRWTTHMHTMARSVACDVPAGPHETVLHAAVRHGHKSLLNDILKHQRGVFLGVRDFQGRTPLHVALQHDHKDIVLLLLDAQTKGHDIGLETRDAQGTSVLTMTFQAFKDDTDLLCKMCEHFTYDQRFQSLCHVLREPMLPVASLKAVWNTTMRTYQDKHGLFLLSYAHPRYHDIIQSSKRPPGTKTASRACKKARRM